MNEHKRMSYFILPFGVITIFIIIITICFKIISGEVDKDKSYGFASPTFAEAHLFHGIVYSQFKNGQWSFIRNGKECKVFNEQYKDNR